jgi:hypothetical protein
MFAYALSTCTRIDSDALIFYGLQRPSIPHLASSSMPELRFCPSIELSTIVKPFLKVLFAFLHFDIFITMC